MPAKVADASVIGAIVFAEPEATTATALLGEDDLYAPTLLSFELASIARTKVLRYPDQRETILRALELGLGMYIQWVDMAPEAVVRLALEVGLSTYDASYLHLARSLGARLVTFDQKLLAASQTSE
jgi:predicted nucleic acid-binding protein